jgi:hypothetical protein
MGGPTIGAEVICKATGERVDEVIERPIYPSSGTTNPLRDANQVECVYDGGFDPAFDWIEVSTPVDAKGKRRRFIRGPRRTDDDLPGLAAR